ncbi:MAG TPA: aldehyde dehydrogenase family protein [Myxococcales bacterium]|nr:aldehyde dehydrogenase family protein [Myxococcales bacterium]HIK84991.1 aldehyde dehydrogenase family protein [Myxococcales bacterium]
MDVIVCADADLDRAADGAVRGSFLNSGHYCCGTERVYVPEAIYEPFVEKVVAQTQALKQSEDCVADVGAIFGDKQMDIIESHVADARAKGARVLVGGKRDRSLSGYFFPPTVVDDVDHDMDLMRHETFGPIVAIQKVRDEKEAIQLANDSDYGLSGNLWTRDLAKGEAPFGGVKASGVGQVNGEVGIRGYCHLHPIIIDVGKKQASGGYPYTPESAAGLQKLIRTVFGNRLLRWLFV